jgi:hypothetical protein
MYRACEQNYKTISEAGGFLARNLILGLAEKSLNYEL